MPAKRAASSVSVRGLRTWLSRVLAGLRNSAREVQRTCRKVFGVPEYDAYLARFRTAHPGELPLSRGEFLAWALERRHRGTRPRCC
jgi:uncharacterized short protein YbdD (DUF466 family)